MLMITRRAKTFFRDLFFIAGIALPSTHSAFAANFLVTCLNGNDVILFDSAGVATKYFSVNSPTGIALDSSGTLYVGSLYDNAIYKVGPGQVLTPFVTGLNHPYGMAFN